MSRKQPTDLAASVRQRLLNLAKARGEELQLVLARYGVERLLYRLGRTPASEQFVLKGAVLFYVWEREPHRPTRAARAGLMEETTSWMVAGSGAR